MKLSKLWRFNRLVPLALATILLAVPVVTLNGARLTALSRGITSTAVLPTDGGSTPGGYGIAGNFSNLPEAELQSRLAAIRATGATWVRYDLSWSAVQSKGPATYDWSAADRVTAAARAEGLNVIMAVGLTPSWARPAGCTAGERCQPTDVNAYVNFVSAAVKHYQPYGVHTWEVWNEPNIAFRFGPATNPTLYATMLKGAYAAIKQVDPQSIVIGASLAPAASAHGDLRPDDFVTALYDEGAGGSFDALSIHPYTYPLTPAQHAADDAWGQMTTIHAIMSSHGDGQKTIWMTEFGAPTFGRGGSNDRYISEADQAKTIREAAELFESQPWAGPLIWYNWQDTSSSVSSSENYYGLLRQDGSKKPSYNAFVEVASKYQSKK